MTSITTPSSPTYMYLGFQKEKSGSGAMGYRQGK